MTSTGAAAVAVQRTGVIVVGAGYWGMNYIRIFSELGDARVLAVCDKRTERLSEVGRRFSGIELMSDLDEALALPGADAVVIATHASTHREVAGVALTRGKHVLVEKPVTTTSREAAELRTLADRHRCVLLVGHAFLYNPGIRKMKELLSNEEIGKTYYLYARRTGLGPIRMDVNAIWDLAPHDVSIFLYLLGAMPHWVSAVGARLLKNVREDVGFISLGFPEGVVGHIHVSWADPKKVREVVVVGSDKRVVFDDVDALERVRIFEKGVKLAPSGEPTTFGEHSLMLRDGAIVSPPIPVVEPLKHQCGHFIHCIRRGERPITDAAQGEAVVRVMEAVDASIERSGAPVVIAPEQQRFEDAIRELANPVR